MELRPYTVHYMLLITSVGIDPTNIGLFLVLTLSLGRRLEADVPSSMQHPYPSIKRCNLTTWSIGVLKTARCCRSDISESTRLTAAFASNDFLRIYGSHHEASANPSRMALFLRPNSSLRLLSRPDYPYQVLHSPYCGVLWSLLSSPWERLR